MRKFPIKSSIPAVRLYGLRTKMSVAGMVLGYIEKPVFSPTNDSGLKNGIAYVRRSSKKKEDGQSLEIQKREISIRAAHEGYEIVNFFEDDGVTAYRKEALERKGMVELLESALQDSKVEGIFFYEETRVSRQFNDFVEQIVKPIREKNPDIKFYSTNQAGLWDENNILVQAKLVFGLMESQVKSQRAISARENCLEPKQGLPSRPRSRIPYGFKMDEEKEKLDEDPIEAAIVNFIFFLSSWGIGNKRIANLLNDAEIASPSDKSWHSSSIDVILHNVAYLGHYANGIRTDYNHSARKPEGAYQVIKNLYPPIVSNILWELVKQARQLKADWGKIDTPFLLRGLISCKECGILLHAKNRSPAKSNKKYQYLNYECSNCKEKTHIEPVHKEVLSLLFRDWRARLQDSKNFTQNQLNRWEEMLLLKQNSLQVNLEKLDDHKRMLTSNSKHLEEWTEVIEITENQIKGDLIKLSSLLDKIQLLKTDNVLFEVFNHFKDVEKASLSNVEQRSLMFMLVDSVSIDFRDNNKLHLSTRYSPFVDLENSIIQITENPEHDLI